MDRAKLRKYPGTRPITGIAISLTIAMAAAPAYGINGPFKISNFGAGLQIWFEAEAFDQRCPGPSQVDPQDVHPYFPVVDIEGAFAEGELPVGGGRAINRLRGGGGLVRYTFDIGEAGGLEGVWYFWARVINAANRSDYMLVEGDPGDTPIPSGDCDAGGFPGGNGATFPGGSFDDTDDRVFEVNSGSLGPPPIWEWAQPNHEEGHTKQLRNGVNNMFLFRREGADPLTVFWDVFMWTDDPDYIPTDADYLDADVVIPMPRECDPPDTHCQTIDVEPPAGNLEGIYRVTVTAVDEGLEPIRYTLTADNGVEQPRTLIQVGSNVFDLVLWAGTWMLSVTVDDSIDCDDAAPDNTCTFGPIEVFPGPKSDWRLGRVGGGIQIWFQAEDFDERFDELGPDPDPPFEPHAVFPVVAAPGAFGDPAANAVSRSGGNGMLAYHFNIDEAGGLPGPWFFWGRVINPNGQSDYMLVDGDPQDPEVPGGPPFPGGEGSFSFDLGDDRIFEGSTGNPVPPPFWGWRGNQEGHIKELHAGQNTMRIFRLQGDPTVFWDLFVWADDPSYRPKEEDYVLAEPMDRPPCTDDADTHCRSFSVEGPEGNLEGVRTVTVSADDDDGDEIIYTLTADNGIDPPKRVVQTGSNVLNILLTPGTWTLRVSVDDDRICRDEAPDAACAEQVVIEVLPIPKLGDFKVSAFGAGVQIWFEAEDYTERFDSIGPDPDPPIEPHPFFPVIDRFGAFFKAVGRNGGAGGMLRYEFDISRIDGGVAGTWYFWGRVLNPGGRSDYLLVPGDPGDPVIPDGPPFPGGNSATFPDPAGGPNGRFDDLDDRVFETDTVGNAIGGWGWSQPNHEEGHTKELQDGLNEMRLFHREGNNTVIWDVFMWTNDPAYVPTDQDYLNATPMSREGERICNDNVDNDGDGLIDCDDPECALARNCLAVEFLRGDTDANGSLEITDPINLLGFLFLGEGRPPCFDAADADDNGSLEITDSIAVLGFMFLGEAALPAPGPFSCGSDPTEEAPGADFGCNYPPASCR